MTARRRARRTIGSVVAVEPLAQEDDEPSRRLAETIARAVVARAADVSGTEVERLVAVELARFRDARVRQYLPILVARAVLERLDARSPLARGAAR